MSSVYRKINTSLWNDRHFRRLSRPAPNAQYLWLYLLTGPHTTAFPGLWYVGAATLAERLGWETAATRACLRELATIKDDGAPLLVIDDENSVLFAPAAMRHNRPEAPNAAIAWARATALIPECALRETAVRQAFALLADHGPHHQEAFRRTLAEAQIAPPEMPLAPPPTITPTMPPTTEGLRDDEAGAPLAAGCGQPSANQQHEHEKELSLIVPSEIAPAAPPQTTAIPTLQEAVSAPEKYNSTRQANALYDAWRARNNAHARCRAVRNIAKLLVRDRVPLARLAAAFEHYSAQQDAFGTAPHFRKTASNFYGQDALWEEFAEGPPAQPQTAVTRAAEHAATIGMHLQELFKFMWSGGFRANAAAVEALVGSAAAPLVFRLADEGAFAEWAQMPTVEVRRRLADAARRLEKCEP